MAENSRKLRTWIGFLAMSGGTFMAVLDTQIVAGSLPEIGASLGATVKEASWIQTAYMIAEVIMIPLAGWLSRSMSLRYLYSLACALFTLASLLCAFAYLEGKEGYPLNLGQGSKVCQVTGAVRVRPSPTRPDKANPDTL